MDLSKYVTAAEEGTVYEVKDPNGEPLLQEGSTPEKPKPVTITLAGTDSERWTKAEDIIYNRRQKSSNPRNMFAAKTAEEQRQDAAFLLASVTLAWDGVVLDGKPLECTQANAKMLYLKVKMVREQVDAFLADRRNFTKASSTS